MAFDNILKRRGRNTRKAANPSFSYSNVLGVNYADSIYNMPQGQIPYAVNVDHGKRIGSIIKRDGYESLITSLGAGKVLGLNCWQHSVGDQFLMAWDKNLYLISGNSGSQPGTSQVDWKAGTLTNVEADSSPGDLKLSKGTDFSEADTLTADFNGTHSNTEAVNDAVQLVASGAYTTDVCNGGTVTGYSFYGSWANLANAFDDDIATCAVSADPVHAGDYIEYDFGAGVTKHIRRIRVAASIYPFDLQRYVAGTWGTVASIAPSDFDATYDIPASGASQNWRLISASNQTHAWLVYEVEMMELSVYAASGTYTHTEQDISGVVSTNAATITFNKTTPAGTALAIETRYSTDAGVTWSAWTARASGDTIIPAGTSASAGLVQWRALLTNGSASDTPSLDDVTVAITSRYAALGTGVSPVYDLTNTPSDNLLTFTQTVPANTGVTWYARGSSNNSNFGDWQEVVASGDSMPPMRYVQLKAELTTTDFVSTPTLADFLISYTYAYTKTYKLDIAPLGRVGNLLTGNRVRFCNYEDWCLMADGLRPFMAYITDDTQTTGTAQSGAANVIRLAAGASAVDDFYNNAFITITAGTGAGQVRFIADYNGTTKDATPSEAWTVNPANDSVYSIGSAIKFRNLGVDAPTVAPSFGTAGNYKYKYTFVNADGVESNPSPASASVGTGAITVPVDSSAHNLTAKRKLYRTATSGTVYKYVAEIADNTTTTYTDSTADAALGGLMLDNNQIPPNCDLLFQFTSYVFYANDYEVWFSKAGAPDQVPNNTDDMQLITFPGKVADIKAHPTALIISGENFIATITSNSGFIFDSDPTIDTTTMKVIDNHGGMSFEASAMCLSPNLRSTLLLNTDTGIRATIPGLQDNSIESVPLSKNIQPYYERSVNRDQAAGVFFNNYYLYSMEHMAAGASATERLTFAYDFRTEQWYGPWTFGFSCYTIIDNVLYAGDTVNGKVYRLFSGATDAGSAIKMVADMPMMAPAGENGSCKFINILPIMSSNSVTTSTVLKPKVDEREATIALGTLTATFAGDERPGHNLIRPKKNRIPLPSGHTFSVRIEDDSINPVEIEKLIVEYEVLAISR